MPISGTGLSLSINEVTRHLGLYSVARFNGSDRVAAQQVIRPSQDLNVIAAENDWHISLRSDPVIGDTCVDLEPDETVVIVVLEGEVKVAGRTLITHDAWRQAGPGALRISSTQGRIAVARIRPTKEAHVV